VVAVKESPLPLQTIYVNIDFIDLADLLSCPSAEVTMGACKNCGQDAEFLRHVYPQCEAQHQDQLRRHDAAIAEAASLVVAYAQKQLGHDALVANGSHLCQHPSAPTVSQLRGRLTWL
jgi:hypothetical protein